MKTFSVELRFLIKSPLKGYFYRTQAATSNIYKKYFEKQFLQETEKFYRHEAVTFLEVNSVTEYIKQVLFCFSQIRIHLTIFIIDRSAS